MSETAYLNDDPYALSSGLIDNVDCTVTEAFFVADTGFTQDGSPVTVLELTLSTDNPDKPIVTEKFSCGGGWEIEAGGAKVTRSTGKPNFNQSSRVGELLAHVIAAGGLDALRAKGLPTEAATWQGLNMHWERIGITNPKTQEVKERFLPTKFLGAASTPTTATAAPGGVDAATNAKLKAAAKSATDFTDFIDKAFAIDGVAGNAAAEALATDESFFNEARA